MFDIREYCIQGGSSLFGDSGESINEELSSDIENLVLTAGSSLYLCDRYKNRGVSIDLIYPSCHHPSLYSYILSPDRVRFLLSIYPYRNDLDRIGKIVIRPRYIEAGDIELAALFVKSSRTLVLYLTNYSCQPEGMEENRGFVPAGLERITTDKIIKDSLDNRTRDRKAVPLLWNIISVIDPEGDGEMEKFFLKRESIDNRDFTLLADISHYYKRFGY